MRSLKSASFAVATLGCMACSAAPQTGLSETDKAAIEAAVEARVAGYIDAVEQRDIDGLMDFWADVDEFVLAGDGDLVDRDTWGEQVSQAVANIGVVLDFEVFNGHTYVLAPDAAVHTTQFRWAFEAVDGDTLRSHGSWSYVFKNFDGTWRVVHSAGTHLPG